MLINKRESTGLKHLNDSKVFLLNTRMIWTIFKKILKNKIQIKNSNFDFFFFFFFFDDMIADMFSNKKINLIVAELLIKGRKLNISVVFITESDFAVKNIRLNSTNYFNMKVPNKQEL